MGRGAYRRGFPPFTLRRRACYVRRPGPNPVPWAAFAEGLPRASHPPVWVLPETLSGAGQGKPGIFAHEGEKFPGCYVTDFQNTPRIYTPL